MSDSARALVEELRQCTALESLLLDDLRELLEEPFEQEESRWLPSVLEILCETIDREFALAERGGYLSDVLERFPTWERRVEELRDEHRRLRNKLARLAEAFERSSAGVKLPRRLRDRFHQWIEQYTVHRRTESDLLHEALVLDVGEGE